LIESKAEEDAWRPLVLIKKGTDRIPLFIIHGAGLTVLLFNALSRHMHPHQPVYGLQAPQLEGEGGALHNLADIVEAYAKEIMTVNAEGPFAVAGYSIGGRIAYELAQYFVRLGRRVIFVGIFDTYAGDDEPIRQGFIYACRKATVLLKEKLGVLLRSLHHPVDAMPIRWRGLKHRLSNLVWPSRRKEHDREVAHLRETFAVLAAPMIDAVNRHTLLPYSGRIHLFKARQRLFYVADREFMGWKRYVSDIKVFDVAGVHFDIFTAPNDKTFAETLQSALDEETAAYARECNQELT
jgi:thioesterase domain-containing protein